MIDLSDPTLNRKKKQKLIKELYGEINAEVGKLTDVLKESSPISLYWKTPQKKADKIILESIKSKETRRKSIRNISNCDSFINIVVYFEFLLLFSKFCRNWNVCKSILI